MGKNFSASEAGVNLSCYFNRFQSSSKHAPRMGIPEGQRCNIQKSNKKSEKVKLRECGRGDTQTTTHTVLACAPLSKCVIRMNITGGGPAKKKAPRDLGCQ